MRYNPKSWFKCVSGWVKNETLSQKRTIILFVQTTSCGQWGVFVVLINKFIHTESSGCYFSAKIYEAQITNGCCCKITCKMTRREGVQIVNHSQSAVSWSSVQFVIIVDSQKSCSGQRTNESTKEPSNKLNFRFLTCCVTDETLSWCRQTDMLVDFCPIVQGYARTMGSGTGISGTPDLCVPIWDTLCKGYCFPVA